MEIASQLKEHNIETAGGRIYSQVVGERGTPLILGLHGWSQRNGWQTWKPLMVPLAAQGYFVVSIDMPGWGNSKAWNDRTLDEETAIQVVEAVVDALEYDQAILMGKSWGGGVALSTSLKHPTMVSKLILTAPAFRNPELLAQLTQPVLMAWAEDDPVIPFRYAAEYCKHISNLQLASFGTGGHSAAQKNVEEFLPIAVEFLKSS